MRNLLLIAAIVGVVLILRFYYRRSPAQFLHIVRQFGVALLLLALLFVLVTGRLNWLLALPAAILLLFNRLLPLFRYIPFLHNLYQQYYVKGKTQGSAQSANSAGQRSSVTAHYVRMTLDLDTGVMDGEVRVGAQQGKRLSQLSLQEVLHLLHEWRDDQESVALLQAYLDRYHPDWHTQAEANHSQRNSVSMNSGMSAEEARQILGLNETATENDIIDAHRRLMQKLHPDRGGSNYLASKVNQAKNILLQKFKK